LTHSFVVLTQAGRSFGEFYDYIRKGGVTGRVISTTPHTIARYARLLDGLERGK